MIRLDDLDLHPASIKLDVQGFAHQALLGSRQTLARAKPVFSTLSSWPRSAIVSRTLNWSAKNHERLARSVASLDTEYKTIVETVEENFEVVEPSPELRPGY